MSTIRRIIGFSVVMVLGLLLGNTAQGQGYTMVNGQTININARQQRLGVVYDDGGAMNNYSNSFDGTVVIDAGPYLTLTLNGSYSTESCCDKINIWDGDNQTGTLVANDLSGSGNVNITSRSGRITIQFHTDGSVISSGFAFEYSASGIDCDESACSNTASGLTVSNITPTSADLSWQSSGSGPYYVSIDDGTPVTVTGTTHSFTGLNPNTVYTAKVTSEPSAAFCCYATAQFRTACGPMGAPLTERFDDYEIGTTSIPTCWRMHCNFDGTVPAYISGDAYSSYPASLRLTTTTAGYWSVAVGPRISSPSISSLHLRVKLRAPYSGTSVEVGICNDTTFYSVSSTFTPIDTLAVNTANQWIEFVVPFNTYTGTGQYLAFRMDQSLQGGSNRIIYLDDLFVESCGVWNMGLFKRNAHNLWVQWETYGSPDLTAEYGPAGFLLGTGTTVTAPTSPLQLTGLDASTPYEIRFYPSCTSTVPAESYQSVILTTLEGARNDLNFCEDFEVGDLPTGWRRHNLYDGTPQTSTDYRHSGNRSLRMRPDYTTIMPTVVLPIIDTVEIGNLNVSFWLYSNGYTTGRVVVGVTEYPEVSSDFVPVDTILLDVSNVWRRYQVSLAGYRGDGRYLALRAFDPNTRYNYMYIDDLEVGTCLVSGAYVTNIGSHSVQLRWDTVGATFLGDSIVVEYGGTGFVEGTGTRVAVAVRGDDVQTIGGKQHLTLTGLEADSSYTFLLYGLCDTMVQACNKIRFNAHTLEQDPTLPYCVDFEGMADGSYPSGWFRPSMYDNFPRIYDNGSPKHSGNRAIYLRSYRELENHSTIVLPLLETDSVNGLTVSFYTWGESSDGQTIQIGVMDDPSDESTFTVVGTTTAPYNKWSSSAIPINGYTGTGRYLALRFYNNYYWSSNGLWIDDIVVSDAAAMDRTVGSITSHGATFSWHGAGRAYNGAYVEWDTAGFVRGTGHKDTVDANTFSLTIDTLQPGTTYDFFITAVSSEREASCNYTRSSFTTFDQPTAASYCYGFEDVANDGFPIGWTRAAVYNNSPKVGSDPHTGNRAMYLSCIWHDNTRYNSFATMPYLEEATLDGLNLKFYAKGQGYYGNLVVGMMTSPSDTSTFVPLDTFNIQDNSRWQEKNVDLGRYTGFGRHIAFKHQSSGTCNWCEDWVWIDDITIDRCRVSRVRAYSETSTMVKIDWVPDGAMDSVEIEYGPQGFAPGSGISVTTTDTVVFLSDLEEGSVYDFYVRPYCTSSSQICSESKYSFSTTQQRVGDNWCEDLESHDGNYSMPYHWCRPAMWSEWPKIWTHSDGQRYTAFPSVLEFRADYDGVNIAVLPASEDPLSQLVLSLDMRLHPDYSNPNRCTLIVGAMPDPFDTAAFTPIDTLHPDFFYHRFDVDLASYSGPYRHLALKYPSSGGRTMLVDALRLSRCRPSQARILAVADSSITLAWRRLGYNDTTRIIYGVEGEDFADGTLVNVVGTDTTFSQLYPDTVYWFYLFGGCADTLIQCQGVHIRQKTLSEPMTVPVCFKFEDSPLSVGLPNGWVRPYGNTEACISGSSNYNHTWQGSRALRLYAYSCDNIDHDRTNMVAMPTLLASSLSGLWLEFYSMSTDSRLKIIVGIMSDPNDSATFTPLDTIAGSSGWLRHTIDLSPYSGSGRNIAFKSFAPVCSSGDIYIDDISIRPCIVTTALAGMPTNHSLVLSYTTSSGATGAWVEYRRVGGAGQDFAPGTGDTVHITSSTYTFTGLDEATWYAFHVYPDCGDGSDGCSYVVTIAQTLHPGVDIPYCESFDLYSSGNYPNNWRRHTSSSDDRPYIYSGANHSSDNAMYFQVDGEGFAMAVMPRLNVGPTCPVVDSLYANFWLYSDYNWNAAALIVGIVTDANNPDSFIPIDTLRPTDYAIWEHHTVAIRNFSSTDTYVAYKFVSTDNSYASIRMDDLCMEKCVAADVTVSNITQNSVTVSWISYGVDSLVCEYGPRGFAAGSGTTVVLHGSPAVISGLLDGTDYQFTFASVCGCRQYGATYSSGGGSSGGGGGGGGYRYYGWCWGWTWHQAINPSDSNYWYWCWGPWHGHSWSWTPGGGGGGTTYYPPVVDTATTQASFLQIPYCESFEDYDTIAWPRSWRRIGGQTPGFPTLTRNNHHSGQLSLEFYASPGSSNHAAFAPLQPGTASSLVLSFYAYSNNSYATGATGRFIVGVMTDPDNPSSFSPVDTVRLSSTSVWEQHVIDLAPYTGSGQYVAFRFAPINASYHYYIDDIYLGTCAISHATTTTTPTGVTLSWQSHHTPTGVNVEYGPQGFTPGSTSSQGSLQFTSSPVNLSDYGILPSDNYDLYVATICDDTAGGCFTSPITLNPRLYLPYCEDFEDLPTPDWPEAVLPSRWKVVQRNNYYPQYPRNEYQHNQNVIAFYPGTGDRSNTVLLPPLPDNDTLDGKWVYAYFSTSNNNYIFLDFGYLADTNNPSSFTQMGSLSNGASEQLREFNIQLTAPAPIGNRFAIRARSTNGNQWLRLSRLVVSNYPYPTAITSTALGVDKRRITWSSQYNNPYYSIQYGYADQWQTITLSDSCSATLTGLRPGRDYQVYFISPDGERLCLPYRFTNEEYLSLPYCDDFESYSQYSVPNSWSRAVSWTSSYSYPRVEYNVHYTSPYRSLQFYNGCGSNRWSQLSMPDIDIDSIRCLSLSFRMRFDYSTNNIMIVGVQTSQSDPSSFTPVDTLYGTSSWQTYNISLSRYSDAGRYITFRHLQTNGSCHYAYIDDLNISACPLPDFTVAGARQVKAQLPDNSVPDYYIEYDTAGFEQGTGTIVHVTENPYFITELAPNTRYSFYSRCDSLSITCAAPTILTTAQELTLPYCDNFDNYNNNSMPTGWRKSNPYNNDYPCKNHNGHIQFYNSCYSNSRSYAVMPDIDIDSLRHAELYMNVWSERSNFYFIVGVMDDPDNTSTFTPVDTLRPSGTDAWYAMHASMARYQGNGRFIAFCMVAPTGNCSSMYIDNLRIDNYPTPQITLYDANTVRIVRGNQRDFWIEMAPQDTVQGDDTNRWFHITRDTFDITGLDYLTSYDFYHHADSGTITCFPRTRITTSTVLPMPYCDNFDSYSSNSIPPSWSSWRPSTDCYVYINNNGELEFYNSYYNGYRTFAIMPELDIDSLKNAELTFSLYTRDYWSSFDMIVGVLSDQNDINTFVAIDTVRNTTTGTWQAQHVSLSQYRHDGRFIAFCLSMKSTGFPHVYIDNLYIQSCPRPSIQLVGGTTVAAIVDTDYSADYWLEYGPQGMTPGEIDTIYNADSTAYTLQTHNTLLHVTSDTLLLTDLTDNTTYDFYTRCDSTHTSCYPLTAQITTSRVQDVPYCEEFATYGTGNNAFPTGWRRHITGNDNSRLYINNDGDAADNRSLRFYLYNSLYAYAVLPEMAVDDIRTLSLSAKVWSQCNVNVNTLFLEVGVMTNMDDISTFQVVDTLRTTEACRWEELGTSLADYQGDGRFIAIRIRETQGSTRAIYIDRLEIRSCDIPANTNVILHSHNQVRIEADGQSRTGFWVEYGATGFEQGMGNFEYVDTLPMVLTLDNNTTYDFYLRCDTLTPTCTPLQTVTTLPPPTTVPYCENFDSYGNNTLPTNWQRLNMDNNATIAVVSSEHHSGGKSLKVSSYNQRTIYAVLPYFETDSVQELTMSLWLKGDSHTELTVGVMSDPNDAASFMAIKQISTPSDWTRYLVSFSSAPSEGRFIALRYTSDYYYYPVLYIDDLFLSSCGATDWRITEVESNQITFDWKYTGEPTISLEYGPIGFTSGNGTVVSITTPPPYTLTGLDGLTNYSFHFNAACSESNGFCTTNYSDSSSIFTPSGGTGCIDPTNLGAEYTTCFYGSFGNPYQNRGTVDYGYENILSRHTVHYDTTERDVRTGGLLRTVPEGARSSVRLGNWGGGGEAEAVSYSLYVDSSQFDLLILKYAAVLQDRMHPSTSQPRFKIEILDENGTLIDANCGAADFIANQNLGWNLVEESFVLWKDWTTVGIDMSAYYGRTVQIRLTTYDCGDGQHYGYAYFTLNCLQKTMISERCGEVDSNRFSAPSGFAYNWYTNLDTTIFSHEQSIIVPSNNAITYYCNCAFVDKADCFFTLSAFAGTRYPLAQMEYTQRVENCKIYVDFRNTSTISADGVTPIGSGEGCETAWWDLGNGDTVTTYNAQTVYNSSGTYTVTLVSSIAGGECTDTAIYTIDVSMNSILPTISGPSSACSGDTIGLEVGNALNCLWSTGETDSAITVTVGPQDNWHCVVVDSNGCADTLRHTVTIHPVYDITLDTNIYKDLFPVDWPPYSIALDDHMLNGGDTMLSFHLMSVQNCDSIVNYNLSALFDITMELDSVICESSLPLRWNDSLFVMAGSKQTVLQTVYGGDSTITMNLTVIPTTYGSFLDTIVENRLPYPFLSHTYTADTIGDTLMLTNAAGCDSILTYSLTVHRNSVETHDTTVCESLLPLPFYSHTFVRDELEELSQGMLTHTVHDTLTRLSGADSVLHITLRAITIPSLIPSADTTIRRGDSTTLRATTSHGTLVWLDADGAQLASGDSLVATPSVHTTYYLSSLNIDEGANLVLNGDFETGNTGFTTDYTFGNTGSHGHYYVGHDIAEMWPWDSPGFAVGDHSSGTGQMLMVDGATQPNTTVWSQTLTVTPHTDYLFSSWVLTDNQGFFKYEINGAQAGFDYASPEVEWEWQRYSQLWNSDTCTQATLRIVNRYSRSAGYDYCIDDISFTPLTACSVLDSVTVRTLVSTTTDSVVCDNHLPILWHGQSLDSTGIYSDTVRGETVDTLALLHLTVNLVTASDTTAVACDSLLWHDSCYYSTGTPTHVVANSADCDSTITLHLTVNRSSASDTIAQVCDSLIWQGTTYRTGGDYPGTIPLQNSVGCDSTITLHLTVNLSTRGDTIANECDSFIWYNTSYTTDTDTATHHIANTVGCDSTVTLHLTLRHSTDTTIVDTIVENQLPYPFNGVSFDDSISHTSLTITNAANCDSIVDYSLFVFRNVEQSVDSALCNDELPLVWNGVSFDTTVTQSTTLTRTATLPAATGADSLVVMNLTVHPLYNHHLDTAICDNQSFSFGDSTFLGSNGTIQHSDTLLSVHGCDSLSTLHLSVHPTFDHKTYDTICSNQNIAFSGGTYDTTGVYPHLLTSLHGCDSLSTLYLQVHPAYDNHTYDSICDDSSRFFIDSAYRQTGVYPYESSSSLGCDSLETLHLRVYPTYTIELYDTIYDGDRYTFEGNAYDTTGTYPVLLQATFGCDSLRTLHLQRNRRTYNDSTLCQNDLPLVWNGITFSDQPHSGSLQTMADSVHLSGIDGIDSLVVMRLTVHDTAATLLQRHACDSLRWEDDSLYTASTDEPWLRLTGSAGCDSVLHLALTVDYTHPATDSIQACDSIHWIDGNWYRDDTTGVIATISTAAGCDSIVTLVLSTKPTLRTALTDTMCHNDTYSWHGLSASSDNHRQAEIFTLVDSLKAVDGCDSVVTLTLTKLPLPTFSFDTTVLCNTRSYSLKANVKAPRTPGADPQPLPYLVWSSSPADSLLDDHEQDNPIVVKPTSRTEYMLYADYSETPLCPATASVSLSPVIVPEARLQVNPEALTSDHLYFTAYDISHHQQARRTWYLDWQRQPEQGSSISRTATPDKDSLIVALELYDGICFDTAVKVVPINIVKFIAPNVFTPGRDDNSRFFVDGIGIISGELYIYNREGLLVYHTDDYRQGWNGKSSNGTTCRQGNYVWKLVYHADDRPTATRTEIGSVLLLQ